MLALTVPIIGFLLVVLASLSHADTLESVIDASGSHPDVICEPPPGAPTLTEILQDALRFAIDPEASAGPIRKLVQLRPEHLVAAATALSLNGESWQKFDHAMVTFTAPARVNRSEMERMMESVTASAATNQVSDLDLAWMWQRLHQTQPIEEVGTDWACLRSEQHDEETIHAVLGHGLKSCGMLERVDDLSEAEAMAASQEWTWIELKRLYGREVAIDGTELTAPLYAIREVRFSGNLTSP